MKHIIEIELPDGQAIPTVEDIARLTNGNKTGYWSIENTKQVKK